MRPLQLLAIERLEATTSGPFASMAAAYARAGIATFPVGGPEGKRPLVKQPQLFGCRASLGLVDLERFVDANIALVRSS